MHRSLIVARIAPTAVNRVADLFRESDATDLPDKVGVLRRSLYVRDDLYIPLLETAEPSESALRPAQQEPEFHRVSPRLGDYIRPYDPDTGRSPADALAR